MRPIGTCAAFVCALILLHCLVCTPGTLAARDVAASSDGFRFQPRKLLRHAAARAAGTQPLNAAAAAAAAAAATGEGRGVGASLKKQTPSKSNPKQN
ncbi:hypothetical protein HU200_024135 [Digitaria exilis]|uniref:Secreted protein n=1 Tax=Digitaria exilis TaxID=1010633 RepID=A0A835BZG6_9POAL|nr:hypothetical protein HU200_024135 [Digitaria exilis]